MVLIRGWRLVALLILLALAHPASAQDDESPTFELSSSETFTTRDQPAFGLGYRRLAQLDFRVYKVRDPIAFFAGLRDAHMFGSREPLVPTEQSWIERLTAWKRGQRSGIRSFFRDQVSYDYRAQRRRQQDRQAIARRVVLNRATFAQVPLLNPDQLVTSWRELLPNYRDFDYRRVPLDIHEEGIYVVEAVSGGLRAYTIVMVGDIGLVTKSSPQEMLAFTADRLTGEPAAGCDIKVLANQQTIGESRTGADGVARLTLPEIETDSAITIARCGDRTAVTASGGYALSEPARRLSAYIYTDKPIYRPGHTVRMKGVLRWRDRDALSPFDRPSVDVSVTDITGKVVARSTLAVDAFGAVNTSIPLSVAAALGEYTIRIASGGETALGGFEVQEYRRPEFEVVVTPTSRFVTQGEKATATVQARYYFGQPVANAKVQYSVATNYYSSPLRYSTDAEEFGESGFGYGGSEVEQGELRLDAQGRGQITVDTPVTTDGTDRTLQIEARVTDASSRDMTGRAVIHATYGTFMVIADVDGYVYRPGQAVQVKLRAVDYLGMPRGGLPLAIVVERYDYPNGYYSAAVRTKISESRATLDANGDAVATVAIGRDTGSYRITASTPEGGRSIAGFTYVYVPEVTRETQETRDQYLEVIADRRDYRPGETARLLLRGQPLAGPVLVTKEGEHVMWHQLVRAVAGEPLTVPIETADAGDVYVSLVYMRDGRLHRAERRLGVSSADKTLNVTLVADNEKARPQQPASYSVRVTNAAGDPVRAQLSLGVIDEAIYAIKPDDTVDPVRFFYRREYSRVSDSYSGSYYFSGYAGNQRLQLARRRRRPFTLADFKGDREVQPQVRKDFSDAIYWIADLVTGDDGTAKVTLKYPDALTTWRLTARAVTRNTLAGASIARTVTTKDLIVRVITPRFLTQGDRVTIPGIVHNYTDTAKETTLSIDVTGLDPVAAVPGPTTLALPAGGEHRQNWQYIANTAGAAAITGTARTDTDSDAVQLPVPILPYGLRREDAVSGSIAGAGEAAGDVSIPSSANASGRTIRVSLAPSIAGSLLGSLDYLTSYPYGCTEQTLSSFVPNLVVTRTLTQLGLTPTEALSVLDRQVAAGLNRIFDYQHDDGGWGWWKTDENHPFMTAYAVYGLVQARDAGYAVDRGRFDRAVRSLVEQYARYPAAQPDLKVYMIFVLGRAIPSDGSVDIPGRPAPGAKPYRTTDALDEIWNARNRMSAYGRALLLQALDDARDPRGAEAAAQLLAEATTQGELSFWETDHDPLLFDIADTSVEATATAVGALARRDPQNPVLDRAVRWLMLKRSGSYWFSTKQTAMTLYGLLELLRARNETPSTFTADVFVNGTLAASQTFTPASLTNPEPAVVTIPAREGVNNVRVVKRGGGTLYWSATGIYFDPTAAEARKGSRQLAINRTYRRLESVKVGDVFQYREAVVSGSVNPGDLLVVHLTVAGSPDWSYLAIEDPLPAGFEGVRDTSAYSLVSDSRFEFWSGARVEYRDDKTVFFEPKLPGGRYEYIYLIKAISSGTFRAVPAQVSPMYVPDVAAASEPFTVAVSTPETAAP